MNCASKGIALNGRNSSYHCTVLSRIDARIDEACFVNVLKIW